MWERGGSSTMEDERSPLLEGYRRRALTHGMSFTHGVKPTRRRTSFRELNTDSTMLDRLVFCYDQKPMKQTGFWPRTGLSSAHFSFDLADYLSDADIESILDSRQLEHEKRITLTTTGYEAMLNNAIPSELEITTDLPSHEGLYRVSSAETVNGWPFFEQVRNAGNRIISGIDGKWEVQNQAGRVVVSSSEPHAGHGPHEIRTWIEPVNQTPKKFLATIPPTTFLTVAGFAALIAGVTAMSSIGPVAVSFSSINGMLLGCWVAQALAMVFFLLSVFVSLVVPIEPGQRSVSWLLEWTSDTGPGGLQVLLLAGIFSGIGSGCWTLSFTMTSVPLAYLFASFSPSVIVFCRMVAVSAGVPPSKYEIFGVAVGIFGGLLTCFGAGGTSAVVGFGLKQIVGNLLAFVCSVSNAVCGMCGKFSSCVPTVYYLTGVCILSAVTQGVLAWLVLPSVSLTKDPLTGVFGWMDPLWKQPFILLVGCFVIGQWGIFFFLQVGTALQQATVMTTQPIIATIMGVLVFGTQASWPDMLGTFGGLVSILGSLIVIIAGQKHELPSEN